MLYWPAKHLKIWLLVCIVCLLPLVAAAKDFYRVLGVKPHASEREIKSAYRKKARHMHPDKHPDKAEAFMEVSEAYQVLSDPELRRVYDSHGADAALQHQSRKENGHGDPFDLFRQFFGGGPSRSNDQTPKGASKIYQAEISLSDLYLGRSFTLVHERHVVCPSCFGSGAHSTADIRTCTQCRGSGVQILRQEIMPGFVTSMQSTCPHCQGQGRMIARTCSRCHGQKVLPDTTDIEVEVDAGAREGAEYIFEGMADQDPDMDAGDVIVKVHTTTSPGDFRRMGHNLYYIYTISLHDALLGFDHTLSHYDGHPIHIKRASVTQPGQVIRIPSEGLPIPYDEKDLAHGKEYGDLFVEFQVILPQVHDHKTRKSLASLLEQPIAHKDL